MRRNPETILSSHETQSPDQAVGEEAEGRQGEDDDGVGGLSLDPYFPDPRVGRVCLLYVLQGKRCLPPTFLGAT